MNGTMDETRFAESLDRYGADPERWPATLREPARELLAASARARSLASEAERLETLLDEILPAPPVPVGLRTRILAGLPNREAWIEWLAATLWRPASIAFLPLVFGFGVGFGVAEDPGDVEGHVLLAFSESALAEIDVLGEQP